MSFDNPENEVLGRILSRTIVEENARKRKAKEQGSANNTNPGGNQMENAEAASKTTLQDEIKLQNEADMVKIEEIRARFLGKNESRPGVNSAHTIKENSEIVPLEKLYNMKQQRLREKIEILEKQAEEIEARITILLEYPNSSKIVIEEFKKRKAILEELEKMRAEFREAGDKYEEALCDRMKKGISNLDVEIAELEKQAEDAGFNDVSDIRNKIVLLKQEKANMEDAVRILEG